MVEAGEALDRLLSEVRRVARAGGDANLAVKQLLHASECLIRQAAELIEAQIEPNNGPGVLVRVIGPATGPHAQRSAAKRIYDRRRVRDRVFDDPTLFGEPGWDILLDLFSGEAIGRKISVTSACIASAVPPTTALRWITVLEKRGLVEREDDKLDSRRTFLSLSAKGRRCMENYFLELGKRGLAE